MQRPKQRHVQNFRDKLQETEKAEKSCENGAPESENPSPFQDRDPDLIPTPSFGQSPTTLNQTQN